MGARRRRRIALLVVTAAGVLLAAALAAGRRALAERALVRWLGAHGIRAAPRVAAFGLGGFEIRGLTVGSSGAPDLMVGRIVVRWSPWSLLAGRAGGIDVFGARLKLGWTDGRLAAGALETLLERPDTGDTPDTGARLPPLEAVRFHDLRITLATPAGRIAARGPLEAVFDAGGTRASATFRGTTPWGPVALAAGVRAAASTPAIRWRARLSSARVELPGVARASNLVVRARGAGASLRARFAADGARGTAEPPPLGAARLTGTLRGSLERLQLDASATLESAPLALTANGTLEPRRGRADLALRIPETPLDAVQPGRAIPVLADTVTQLRGSLAGEGRARYADGAKRAELSLALREADVVTPSATLRGVSGVVTFLGPPGVTTPPGQHLAMAAIEGPLPLEDGLLVFRLEPDAVLHLEQAGWRLAGGRVQTSGRVPLAANERTVTLTVEDLDVATLLESIAFEGLSGSGTLSGTIPLRQRGERLLVENGQLTATATGTLRYRRPGAAASGGGQLDLLLGVLDDFRYDALSLGLDGDLAEPMAMTIKLRGRNPTYQGGRPVVFNVTIEAPLAGLLRTGRSTYRIPPAIEKRLEAMGLHEPAGR